MKEDALLETHKHLWCTVILRVTAIGVFAVLGGYFSSPQFIMAAQNPKAQSAVVVTSAQESIVEKNHLARKEAVDALSKYVDETYTSLCTMERLYDLYLARLKQDIKQNDLGKLKADVIELEKVMQVEADELALVGYPDDSLDDSYREQFAAIALATVVVYDGMVMITTDILAHEHLGTNLRKDLKRDRLSIQKAIADYRKRVMAAYDFFGYSAKQINRKTLRIKPGAQPVKNRLSKQ